MKNKIEFKLEKNIHMYNHRLTIIYNNEEYSSIIEENTKNCLNIWLKDFNLPEDKEIDIRFALYNWLSKQDYNVIFEKGSRV